MSYDAVDAAEHVCSEARLEVDTPQWDRVSGAAFDALMVAFRAGIESQGETISSLEDRIKKAFGLIEKVLKDEESRPGGWGPDVTCVSYLVEAAGILKSDGGMDAGTATRTTAGSPEVGAEQPRPGGSTPSILPSAEPRCETCGRPRNAHPPEGSTCHRLDLHDPPPGILEHKLMCIAPITGESCDCKPGDAARARGEGQPPSAVRPCTSCKRVELNIYGIYKDGPLCVGCSLHQGSGSCRPCKGEQRA